MPTKIVEQSSMGAPLLFLYQYCHLECHFPDLFCRASEKATLRATNYTCTSIKFFGKFVWPIWACSWIFWPFSITSKSEKKNRWLLFAVRTLLVLSAIFEIVCCFEVHACTSKHGTQYVVKPEKLSQTSNGTPNIITWSYLLKKNIYTEVY